MSDIRFVYNHPDIPAQIKGFQEPANREAARQKILKWVVPMFKNQRYQSMEIYNAKGHQIFAYPDNGQPQTTMLLDEFQQAVSSRSVVFSDLQRDSSGVIRMYLVAPFVDVRRNESISLGFVVFCIDPFKVLYPLIQSWPIPSSSSEALVVEHEGTNVLYMNELRHRSGTALSMRIPIENEQLPAAMAVQGREGVVEGNDYRNVEVLAAIRKIHNSPWFLIVKIDSEEVFAPVRSQALTIVIIGFLFIISVGLSFGIWWRNQRAKFFKQQYENERERQALMKHFDYLIKYANDIILLLDSNGVILEANEQACRSYGYTREELLQRTVYELRSPESRSQVSAQLQKVASQDGMVFESTHMRRDRMEFSVEVSSRVMVIDGHNYYQSIIRDITERKFVEEERKRADDAIRKSEANLARAQELAKIGSWEADLQTGKLDWSDEMYRIYDVTPGIFEPTVESLLERIHPDDRGTLQDWITATVRGEFRDPIDLRVITRDGSMARLKDLAYQSWMVREMLPVLWEPRRILQFRWAPNRRY
ncbi:MAG: PAS domain S-box protein [bacterium]